MNLHLLTGILLGICLSVNSFPQSSGPQPRMDRLIVHGSNFAFGVKEPEGWRGDTGSATEKYRVNIVFFPTAPESQVRDVTIRVRVNKKVDENTIEDLNYDMEQYKKRYPGAEFKELNASHDEYKVFAKVVSVPKKFYEYVAYVNPGPTSQFVFSVAMSKQEIPATDAELTAYQTVLRSLRWLTGAVSIKP